MVQKFDLEAMKVLAAGHETAEALVANLKRSFSERKCEPATTIRMYKVEDWLGKGAFARVVRAKHCLTGRDVAIKLIDKLHIRNLGCKGRVYQELEVLKRLTSPHIVRILEFFEDDNYYYLVFEHLGGGDLGKLTRGLGRLPEAHA